MSDNIAHALSPPPKKNDRIHLYSKKTVKTARTVLLCGYIGNFPVGPIKIEKKMYTSSPFWNPHKSLLASLAIIAVFVPTMAFKSICTTMFCYLMKTYTEGRREGSNMGVYKTKIWSVVWKDILQYNVLCFEGWRPPEIEKCAPRTSWQVGGTPPFCRGSGGVARFLMIVEATKRGDF